MGAKYTPRAPLRRNQTTWQLLRLLRLARAACLGGGGLGLLLRAGAGAVAGAGAFPLGTTPRGLTLVARPLLGHVCCSWLKTAGILAGGVFGASGVFVTAAGRAGEADEEQGGERAEQVVEQVALR